MSLVVAKAAAALALKAKSAHAVNERSPQKLSKQEKLLRTWLMVQISIRKEVHLVKGLQSECTLVAAG